MTAGIKSRLLIIGQAPGRRVHETGIPWNDPSGDNLRAWLHMDKSVFYDSSKVSLMPMGFCYPGTGKSGDLPPRPECDPHGMPRSGEMMPDIQLTLLIGQYAQRYYLGNMAKENLTETVRAFENYLPVDLPLPHPSPRNNIWLRKNEWFAAELLPELKRIVAALMP